MVMNEDGELETCSMDDTLRFTNIKKKEYWWVFASNVDNDLLRFITKQIQISSKFLL